MGSLQPWTVQGLTQAYQSVTLVPMSKTPRLQIRQKTYRGTHGYLISGTDAYGRRPSVFTHTKTSALRIKARLANGLAITAADFAL